MSYNDRKLKRFLEEDLLLFPGSWISPPPGHKALRALRKSDTTKDQRGTKARGGSTARQFHPTLGWWMDSPHTPAQHQTHFRVRTHYTFFKRQS